MENAELCSRASSWAFGGSLALVFASVIAFGSYREVSLGATKFEHRAQLAFDKINSAADIVEGVLVSLGVSSTDETDLLHTEDVAYAVLSDYRFVTAMGRYQQVAADQRASFENSLQGSVIPRLWEYKFEYGDNLSIVSAGTRNQHFPVLYATDRQGALRDLKGLDFASKPSLIRALGEALNSDQSTLLSAADTWSAGGQLWVLGGVAQTDRAARSGHWVELDLLNMVLADLEWPGIALASVELIARSFEFDESAAGPVSLLSASIGNETEGRFALRFLRSHQWTGVFDVGGHTLRATFTQTPSVGWQGLVFSVVLATLSVMLLLTVFLLNLRRRAAVKMQQAQVARLHKAQQQASVTLASIRDTVITIDNDSMVVYANAAANELLKLTTDSIVDQPIEQVLKLSDDRRDRLHPDGRLVSPDFLTNEQSSCEFNLERFGGGHVAVSQTNSPLYDISGNRAGNVLVLRDISVERELTAALKHQANHDPLTGIANRLRFEQVMGELFLPDAENDCGHALCYIDLDQFKLVNDTCGHAAGDELLIDLVEGLRRTVREHDLVARLGGDEFAIVIRDCSLKSSEKVIQRVYNHFQSSHFQHSGNVFPVRASIGFVHFKPSKSSIEDLLLAADTACYEAKRLGRNQVCRRDIVEDHVASVNGELDLVTIRKAIELGGFELDSREIVNINDQSILGVQYQLVLDCAAGHRHGTSEILSVAERHGLMRDIDKWYLERVINNACGKAHSTGQLTMVELSSATLRDPEVTTALHHLVSHNTIEARQLCIVVSESVLIKDLAILSANIQALRDSGYKIAIACTGSSISSIQSLTMIPMHYIMLEIEQVDNNQSGFENGLKQLAASVAVASALGAEVIGGRVRHASVQQMCAQVGVRWIQGNLVRDSKDFRHAA